MKKYLIALFILTATYVHAQDSLYIYKSGAVEVKRAIAQIDSVTFSRTQDTLNILKGGNVVFKRALVNIDSLSFTQPLIASTYKDLDGNIYHTVRIGTQTWMIENLRTTKFRNGESIPNITNNTAWTNNTSAAWCDYDNDPANGTVFGHLYNWYAATDGRNIAPAGWHVPTDDEWNTLENYLIANGYNYDGSTTGNKIAKSLASTTYWKINTGTGAPGNNAANNNATGFNALPGGGRYGTSGVFFSMTEGGFWWSTNQTSDIEASYESILGEYYHFTNYTSSKSTGFSIRCIKSDIPSLSTSIVTSITINSAISGGSISSDSNDPVTVRGVCWDTSTNPTINNNKTIDGSGTGSFASALTGLIPATTYYVRAYAINSAGTAYSNEVSFTTLATTPTLTTSNVSAITSTTAMAGGVISTDGGAGVTSRGVCWSTSENPTISDSKTIDGAGSGEFTSSITGLIPGTTYYVRAYAANSVGIAYGIEVSFTTNTIPTLTTSNVSAITATTATCGGAVSTDGGAGITVKGVCWSTNEDPTISDSKTIDGTGSGEFTSSITGLIPGTTYYVRAYAVNSVGTAYGIEVSFTTNTTIPTVTTSNVSAITSTTATGGGAISSDGGASIIAKGVCWSTNENPTITDSKTTDGAGTGSFTSSITGLTPGTTYYVRAYAVNSVGTGYGVEINFRTNATIPTLITSNVSAITATTATSGGDISSDGGTGVTTKGVCWSINENPTIADNKTTDGTGTGEFISSITGLTPGTTYYVRAYATNSVGTAYGIEMSFTTNAIPTLITSPISAITSTTATSGGAVSADGGTGVTTKGVCWSINENPTIADNKTTDGTGTGEFTSSITGLTPGTTYYVRAYATNTAGTAYGNEISFTTTQATATIPTLATNAISAITSTTALSGGNISIDGGASVTARGICWSTGQNPTITNNKTTDGSGMGSFSSALTGLIPATTYYVRAYATNTAGTAYGNEISFTTLTPVSGTFQDVDGNTYHSVTIGAQTWMLENLKTTKFRNGDLIPNITDGTTWANTSSAAWCNYNNDPANGVTYGRLYNWYAAGDSRIIAPAGWHVPTVDEWATLKNFLIANGYNYDGTTVNNKMAKSLASTTYWYPSANAGAPGNNQMSNNSTGFTALPGGGRYGIATGDFFSLGIGSFWWSSTQFTDIEAWYKALFYGYSFMGDYGDYKKYGYSIRCIKSDLPVITTTAASSITSTSVVSGGNITFDGNDPITSRGICWNTTGNPTLADSKTTDGSGNGIFNSSISGLNPGTTYYVCAYATNSVGTAYGNVITFKTTATTPTLTTVAVTEITANSATSGGNISNDGGSTITVRGVCWSINPNPTTDHFKTTDGAGPGTFSSALTNLIPGTTYYVRAYATNSIGTAYSNEVSFTTLATTPTLTTSAVSAITSTTAVSGGNISADGGASVTARGVCWSTSQNPTITDGKTTDGNGTGEFSSSLTDLLPGTTYYVRAYATNSAGTAYSNEVSFTTLATTPTLTTSAVSAITSTTAVSGGNISADGGASVTARGVCWSTSQNPTITDSKTTDDNGIGEFSSSITGLTPATTYYVRAYATNSIGTAYSNEVSFTTLATTPTLTTSAVSAITSTTAVSGGIISADGGASITEKGVCWNTAGNPTIADSKTTDGNGNGIFNSSISELNPGTTYYVCAYATNSVGTAYGNVITFKTTATTPTLTTVDVTEITANSATSGGNISNDGGSTITVRGLCWSTNPNPTTDHFKTTDGAGPGAFSSALTNLTSGTTYYVRAYATNDMGTSYGNEVSFNTPSVYTSFISDAKKSVVATDTYVHYRTVIPAIGDANDFDLVADNSIVTDLDELVLATANKDGVLEKTFAAYGLGFAGTDYKFEFSLPVYIGLDGVTNHNSFVTLNPTSNVLTVNQDISAIDRTPLVLVKLKSMEENLLAEAYIKFKISN